MQRSFNYLAFDYESHAILSHAETAVLALQSADDAAPDASILVVFAGPHGRKIWDRQFTSSGAKKPGR